MTLAFVIAPVFTQEIKTDMNSIVLCSFKGRREIVTAKLLSVCSTAVILTALYFIGYFIGAFIANGNIVGFNAPARCYARLFMDDACRSSFWHTCLPYFRIR